MTTFLSHTKLMLAAFAIIVVALLAGCGGGGGGSAGGDDGGGGGNWYYHFSCNGDPACLSTNYAGTASGTSNQGPVYAMCSSLLTFASINWNMPPATNSCSQSATPPPATLVSITVKPANKTLPIGLTQQYTATGNYSDGTSKDITAQVTWYAPPAGIGEPRPPVVASISASGLATATTAGTITITATLGAISGNTKLFVTAATLQFITVSPENPTLNQFLTQQFTATGHYSDGSTQALTSLSVSWNSETPAVATISTTGLATAVAGGTSTIIATFGALSGSTTLNVTTVPLQAITVTPANSSLAKGTTRQFAATGHYADGDRDISAQVTWGSDNPTVADINASGLATGLTLGTSNISATLGSISGSTTLTITAATLQDIAITPVNPSVAQGLTKQLTATGIYSDGTTQEITSQVTWSSGSTTVATIDAGGVVSGVTAGTATISATQGIISGTTTLTVVTPGANWIQAASGITTPLLGVTWSGSQFVAVGAAGTILTSPDGSVWTQRTSGTTNALFAVTKAGDRLVAVGAFGTILTSPDGVTWAPSESGATHYLYATTWTGTQLVAVGNAAHAITSPDGISWTAVAPPIASFQEAFSIAWNGTFYVVGTNSVFNFANFPEAFMSTDLTSWSFLPTLSGLFNYGLLWTGTQFIAVQSSGGIRTSDDGGTWTSRTSGSSAALRAVAWTGSHYAVVGDSGTVLTSPDSVGWTSRPSGTAQNLRGVAWSGANLVAVGDLGTILVSSP